MLIYSKRVCHNINMINIKSEIIINLHDGYFALSANTLWVNNNK